MNGRRYNVQEPELEYGVESDEDWEEPADGELLTVCSTMPAHDDAHVTSVASAALPLLVHARIPCFSWAASENCISSCIAEAVQKLSVPVQ